MTKQNGPESWAKALGLFSIITGELVVLTGAGAGIGFWLGKGTDVGVIAPLFGGLIGFGVAIFMIVRLAEKADLCCFKKSVCVSAAR